MVCVKSQVHLHFEEVRCTSSFLASSAVDPWALPEPQAVTLTCVGDTNMYCTSVVKRDGRLWPFFLARTAYQELVDFVQEVQSPDPQVRGHVKFLFY